MYNLITVNNNHNGYNTRMVITPDGSVYALVITNLAVANTFKTNHPMIQTGNYPPDFPVALADEYNDIYQIQKNLNGMSNIVANEMAMAFILEKYNTGIVLLKQNNNGAFKMLRTTENIDVNGNKIYTVNNCP